jgi:hypothetical protein
MRKHTVTHDDNGWTHEEIIEDGNLERDGIGIGVSDSKVGVGYRKEWFSGVRTHHEHRHTRKLSKKEGTIVMMVFGLLFILIFALVTLYGNV